MCGRFSLTVSPDDLLHSLDIITPVDFAPREEYFPSDLVLCIHTDSQTGIITAQKIRWGFAAPWDSKKCIFNARCESLAEKEIFRQASASRRCLIPATCFYEWSSPEKVKYKVSLKDGSHMALGGILQETSSDDGICGNCSVITTASVDPVAAIHGRMPVIVPSSEYRRWLAPLPLPDDVASKIYSPDSSPKLVLENLSGGLTTGNLFS